MTQRVCMMTGCKLPAVDEVVGVARAIEGVVDVFLCEDHARLLRNGSFDRLSAPPPARPAQLETVTLGTRLTA